MLQIKRINNSTSNLHHFIWLLNILGFNYNIINVEDEHKVSGIIVVDLDGTEYTIKSYIQKLFLVL